MLEAHALPHLHAWKENFEEVPIIKENLPDHDKILFFFKKSRIEMLSASQWFTFVYLYCYIYIYIYKSLLIPPVEPHKLHTSLSFFLSNFPIIVFNICFLNIYTSPTFLIPLTFSSSHYFSNISSSLTFSSPSLPSTLISFFLIPFIFLYFCLLLFTPFYYSIRPTFFVLFKKSNLLREHHLLCCLPFKNV